MLNWGLIKFKGDFLNQVDIFLLDSTFFQKTEEVRFHYVVVVVFVQDWEQFEKDAVVEYVQLLFILGEGYVGGKCKSLVDLVILW